MSTRSGGITERASQRRVLKDEQEFSQHTKRRKAKQTE